MPTRSRITTRELGNLQGTLSGLGYTVQVRRGDAEDPIAALLGRSVLQECEKLLAAG